MSRVPRWPAGVAAAVLVALAATPAGRGDTDPYGKEPFVLGTVIQRELEPQEGQLMREGGISSVRFWLQWPEVEKLPYQYDWSQPDRTVRDIVRDGQTPLPFVFGLPAWAAKLDGYDCSEGECVRFAPRSTSTRAAFARVSRMAVRRYGPGGTFWDDNPGLPYRPVSVWQLWNEPNLSSFFSPRVDPGSYAQLVKVTAAEIRAEDPAAEVLLGGLSGDRTTSRRWSTQSFLRALYRVPGFAASFDGIAVHPYHPRTRGVLAQVALARKIATKRDPGVDLWITEIGWASGGDSAWSLVKTPDGQARMLRRVFRRLIARADRWNLRGAYWYAWRDTPSGQAVCGWCGEAGLRDTSGAPKPAYDALRRLLLG